MTLLCGAFTMCASYYSGADVQAANCLICGSFSLLNQLLVQETESRQSADRVAVSASGSVGTGQEVR